MGSRGDGPSPCQDVLFAQPLAKFSLMDKISQTEGTPSEGKIWVGELVVASEQRAPSSPSGLFDTSMTLSHTIAARVYKLLEPCPHEYGLLCIWLLLPLTLHKVVFCCRA